MASLSNLTIVTACDGGYFWGAFLLVGSLRQSGVSARVHVLGKDFSPAQVKMLEQFDAVSVLPLPPNRRSLSTSKPDALATVETEWMAWLDADCMAIGDISNLLIPRNGQLQIRVRGEAENASVYLKDYRRGERARGIAPRVLEQWKVDVGDLETPRFDSTCVANVIVMHQRYQPFIELWRKQMDKVLVPRMTAVIDRQNGDYHMLDESVLNSVLIWSSLAPEVGREYLLDNLEGAHIAHFSGVPKPWQRWTWRSLRWYEQVLALLDWCAARGLQTPEVPWTFKRRYKPASFALAGAHKAARSARGYAGHLVRSRLLGRGT